MVYIMHIRCQTLKGKYRKSVMICHSVRTGKKVTQKTVRYFGIAKNDEDLATLRKVAELELRRLRGAPPEVKENPPGVEDLREDRRIVEGLHDIFGKIFDGLGIHHLFSRLRLGQLRDVAIARIASPASKARTSDLLAQQYSKVLSEDQIYRLMDRVEPHIDVIKQRIFEATRRLQNDQKVDLMFFDVTTLYFESQKPDALRDFGYSKDHKIGETQVVLALATTQEGLPIGYTLFSGKTAEVSTLLQCLEEWRKTMDIGDVTIVADRAMMSEQNLKTMELKGIRYVVAAKLKQFDKRTKAQILARHEETSIQVGTENVLTKEHNVEGRRLIVSYSESRAQKDISDRQRLLTKLQSKVDGETDPRQLVTNRGYLKFLDSKTKGQVVLNQSKIDEDKRWDGLHGIITNDLTTSSVDLLSRYRRLWVIEESFRLNKHTLAMRPIYHFKPERVATHILICYIAFAMSRHAQHQLRAYGTPMSIEAMRQSLSQVEASIVRSGQTVYRIPSKLDETAETIYRAFGVPRTTAATRILRRLRCSGTSKNQVVVS